MLWYVGTNETVVMDVYASVLVARRATVMLDAYVSVVVGQT